MRENYLLWILVLLIVGATGACSVFEKNSANPKIEEIKSGNYIGYPAKGVIQKKITSQDSFKREWAKAYSELNPAPPLPDVDFEEKVVVMIMTETKSSGGYTINDISISKNQNATVISYKDVTPGDGCMTTQALTRPFVFLSTEKTDKPMHFKRESVTEDCL